MKLWQRYLLGKIAGTFCFLLGCLFIGYVLVDLSIHGPKLAARTNLFLYYVYQFAAHLTLFSSLTFLLASLKVLLDLNGHLEFVALQTGTLSAKKLLLPFFWAAGALSLVCYANEQWFAPNSVAIARKKQASMHVVSLDDKSDLVYQRFDPVKKELVDVFWVRNSHDIWHMKTMSLKPVPTGHGVDHLVRTKQLEKTESFEERVFEELPQIADSPFIPLERRPISALWKQAVKPNVRSHLHSKLMMPLLPVLTLLVIAPFALTFSRKKTAGIFVALSLFGFVTLTTLCESLLILGENQVLPPLVAIWTPVWLILVLAMPRFVRL